MFVHRKGSGWIRRITVGLGFAIGFVLAANPHDGTTRSWIPTLGDGPAVASGADSGSKDLEIDAEIAIGALGETGSAQRAISESSSGSRSVPGADPTNGPYGLRAQLEQATTEIALLREELSIKDGRWKRSRTRRRPHYLPTQRMRILQLRAARGWTVEKTASVFLVDELTLRHWMRRVDEGGERAIVQTVEPVNRYPDFVRPVTGILVAGQ